MRKISKWKRRAVKIRIQKAANSTRIFGLAIKLPPLPPHKQLSRIKKNPKRRQSQHLALRGVYLSSFFSELRGTSHTCDYNVRHYLLSSKQIGKQTETATAARKGEVCKTESLTNKDFSTSQDAA